MSDVDNTPENVENDLEAGENLDPDREIAPEQINDMRYRIQMGQATGEVAELYQVSVENMLGAIKHADMLTVQGANEDVANVPPEDQAALAQAKNGDTAGVAEQFGEGTIDADEAIRQAIEILETAEEDEDDGA